jgi:choline dehydrogenase-like flavoprotein
MFLSPFVINPAFLRRRNIPILALFRAAADQDHKTLSVSAKVDAVAWSKIDLVFEHAAAHALGVGRPDALSCAHLGRSVFRSTVILQGLAAASASAHRHLSLANRRLGIDPKSRLPKQFRFSAIRWRRFSLTKSIPPVNTARSSLAIRCDCLIHFAGGVRLYLQHVNGGAIMGASPETSVVNPWLQHWKAPNLWVVGGSAFPQNGSGNPTLTILAITFRAADALIDM